MKDHKADSQRYFDKLAPNYENHYYGAHGRQQYLRVIAAASAWKFASVLDVGRGTGGLLALMKREAEAGWSGPVASDDNGGEEAPREDCRLESRRLGAPPLEGEQFRSCRHD